MYDYKMNESGWVESEWNPLNFEKVVLKYQPRSYRFINAMLWETHLTQDLTQDTFLLAYKALCKQAETNRLSAKTESIYVSLKNVPTTISAWLYAIARNTAISEMRRQKNFPITSFWYFDEAREEYEFTNSASHHSASDLEYHFTMHDELERAMINVGRERLTALLLHLNGFSYMEICRMTGRNLSNVKSQIFRAKESLRQTLLMPQNSSQKHSQVVGLKV